MAPTWTACVAGSCGECDECELNATSHDPADDYADEWHDRRVDREAADRDFADNYDGPDEG
jgi:hypothetical protein